MDKLERIEEKIDKVLALAITNDEKLRATCKTVAAHGKEITRLGSFCDKTKGILILIALVIPPMVGVIPSCGK